MKYIVSWTERTAYSAEVEAENEESAIETIKSGEFTELATDGEYIEFENDSFKASPRITA